LHHVRIEEQFSLRDGFGKRCYFCYAVKHTSKQIDLFGLNKRFVTLDIDDIIVPDILLRECFVTTVCSADMRFFRHANCTSKCLYMIVYLLMISRDNNII